LFGTTPIKRARMRKRSVANRMSHWRLRPLGARHAITVSAAAAAAALFGASSAAVAVEPIPTGPFAAFSDVALTPSPDAAITPEIVPAQLGPDWRVAESRTPEARARRQRTRRAYRDMSARDARLLAQQAFPSAFRQQAWNGRAERSGAVVERYVSDHGAIVRGGDGERALRLGTLPLRVGSEPVDTALVDRGPAFEQKNGVVDVQIAEKLNDGLTFPGAGVSIRPEIQSGSTPAGSALGATMTWTEIAPDTDFSIAPTPTGVRTLHQLRSVDSPESLEFDVDLPDGAHLASTSDGGLAVDGPDGQVATMSAPLAVDAAGESVNVKVQRTDRGFRLAVPHRSADVTYPLLVDPTVGVEQRYWRDSSAMYIRGWAPTYGPSGYPWDFYNDRPGASRGLTVGSVQTTNYDQGAWGGFRFDPPGTSMLSYVELPQQLFADYGGSFCVEQGLFNTQGYTGTWLHPASGQSGPSPWQGHCSGHYWDHTMAYRVATPTAGNAFLSRIYASSSRYRSGDHSYLYLPGALVHLVDDTPPQSLGISGVDLSKWTKRNVTSVTLSATDSGLGMSHIALAHGSSQVTMGSTSTGCNAGTIANGYQPQMTCPTSHAGTANFVSQEGRREIRIHATNALGTPWPAEYPEVAQTRATRSVVVCQDTIPPTVALSGSLVTGEWKIPRGETRSLKLTAAGEANRSGVTNLAIKRDGTTTLNSATYASSACAVDTPGAPQRELTATIDSTGLAYGLHPLDMTVKDGADNSPPSTDTTKKFMVTDETAPTVRLSGAATLPFMPGGNEVNIVAGDGAQGSGVRRVSVQVDDAAPETYTRDGCVSQYQCPQADWSFPHKLAPGLSDGAHEVKVTAYDAFDRQSIQAVTTVFKASLTSLVRFDQVHDVTRWTTPLLANGWANADPKRWVDSYQGAYRATALGLGLKTIKLTEPLAADDPRPEQRVRSPLTHQPCDGTASSPCPLLLPYPGGASENDVSYDTAGWREGILQPSMRVADQQGGESNKYPGAVIRDPRVEMAVDHSPPTVTTSGSLAQFEGRTITERGRESDHLIVDARDGRLRDDSGAIDESLWRSGVQSIQVEVARNIAYGESEPVFAPYRRKTSRRPAARKSTSDSRIVRSSVTL